MKIIYNKLLPRKGYAAINILGLIFARKECQPLSNRIINHEAIHTQQMKFMLYVFFYLWYGVEWLMRLIQYRKTKEAYYNISFEREAYANHHKPDYLQTRQPYAWLKYLRKDKESR